MLRREIRLTRPALRRDDLGRPEAVVARFVAAALTLVLAP
jgi:hypothetical protein